MKCCTPSTATCATHWDRTDSGAHIAARIAGHDPAEERVWLAEDCRGDYVIMPGERSVSERKGYAALVEVTFR